MAYVDPTTVRLSDHFLLSDFMGNHSVYTKGYKNLFIDPDGSKEAEARYLCESVLEPLLRQYGPLSVSYGYISPELSRNIVTYQDPDKPSYHRWDKGAAADIWLHYPTRVEDTAPIILAHQIDDPGAEGPAYPYSRMITYSESPYICVATQLSEGESPRKAFYENRYCGKKGAKPMYIKKSATPEGRRTQAESLLLSHDWKGEGYPTYHGGGIRQFQHIPVSKYSTVADFLYSTHAIRKGIANAPDLRRVERLFNAAGRTYDGLLKLLDVPRLSIVRGFESFRFNDYPLFSWKDTFAIDCKPPSYISAVTLAETAIYLMQFDGLINAVSCDSESGTVRIVGAPRDDQ